MNDKPRLVGRESREKDESSASMTIEQKEENLKEAHGEEAIGPVSKKAPLFDNDDMPEDVPTIQRDKMLMNYIKPHFMIDKDERTFEMEFSFPLTDDHKGRLPESVEDEWKHISKSTAGKISNFDVPPQTIGIYFAPDMKEEVHLTAAPVTKASISIIEETGAGTSKKVTRFSFRVLVDVSEKMQVVEQFAVRNYGKELWVKMKSTQGRLIK